MVTLVLALAIAVSCPIERASYALRDHPDVTATFHPAPVNADWPNGLALAITMARTKRTYWALPWNGGTDDRQHVRWVRAHGDNLPADYRRRLGDSDFLATDADYDFLDGVPRAGDRAPAHLLLPWIGGEIWHSTTSNARDAVPRAFFDLTGCPAQPAAKVDLALPAVP